MSVMSRTTTPGAPRRDTRASCSPAAGGAVHDACTGGTDDVPGFGLGNGAPPEDPVPADAVARGVGLWVGCEDEEELVPHAVSIPSATSAAAQAFPLIPCSTLLR